MKITYSNYRPVALWHWDVSSGNPAAASKPQQADAASDSGDDADLDGLDEGSDDEEEEEDYGPCAICHSDYDSACPTCKAPGDDCPLIWGKCTHCFHMHCLLKWLDAPSSNETCPMDRRPWENASGAPEVGAGAGGAAVAQEAAQGQPPADGAGEQAAEQDVSMEQDA